MANTARRGWRVIDIIVASILAVACGFIFLIWNFVGGAWFEAMDALTPGLGGLVTGVWLIGGVIGALVIRKPGAALYVETLAACLSAALGSQWRFETIYSGLAQGLGVEIIFLIFAFRRFNLPTAILAGIGSALGAFILELFLTPNLSKSLGFNITYLVCLVISGANLAGALGYAAVQALAKAGALDRFAVGRELRR